MLTSWEKKIIRNAILHKIAEKKKWENEIIIKYNHKRWPCCVHSEDKY